MGMSVASKKTEHDTWKSLARFRRHGENEPGDFTLKERLTYGAVAAGGRLFTRLALDTCRWDIQGDEFRHELLHGGRPYIFLLWHNRLPAFLAWAARNALRSNVFRIGSIISGSKDGEFLARIIREGGGAEIRGSSTRDAARALRGAVRTLESGAHLASVGDGPRGPRYRLKPGPVLLARETGAPIVLFSWACNRVLQLYRAWDQLMVPLPFSHIRVRFDAPFHVPADADDDQLKDIRRDLESRLGDLTDWADANTRVVLPVPRPRPGEVLKRRAQPAIDARRV